MPRDPSSPASPGLPPIEVARFRPLTAAIANDAEPRRQLQLLLEAIVDLSGGTRAIALARPARLARVCNVVVRGQEVAPISERGALVVDGPLADALLRHEGSSEPLKADGGARLLLPLPRGGVCVEGPAPEAFTEPDRLTLLQCLAELVAGALLLAGRLDEGHQRALALGAASARLHEQNRLLQELAVLDEVTGLHNRRYFHQRLEDELGRVTRYGRPLTLVLFDVDHFKQVNDRHGHPVGDRVLQHVGSEARRAARKVDLVARFGGDEFAILLPETDVDGGAVVAERLRASLAAAPAPGTGLRVTLSMGVAGVGPGWSGDGASLVRLADDALYRSKQAGRDRITVVAQVGV